MHNERILIAVKKNDVDEVEKCLKKRAADINYECIFQFI